MSSTCSKVLVPPRLSHLRRSRPQHDRKIQPNPLTIMFLVEAVPPEADAEVSPPKGAKVTQRMLQLRELIAEGAYPDKDELAERIVDKL